MPNVIYPLGNKSVTIPATESIAVYTKGRALVYRDLGYPNLPSQRDLLAEVSNTQTVFGSYTSGATIVIEAGADQVIYEVGTAPLVMPIYGSRVQATPVALNSTGTITVGGMMGGIITSTTGAAVAATLPTGTVLDLASEFDIGESFTWSVINTGGNTFTVTAAASGNTIVGAAAVVTATSALFRTLKTAANTFVNYRLS